MRKKTTRGRKPIHRSLPPISETCAAFKGFEAEESRVERIFEVLATAIQHLRRAVPQPFYAMRDVAAFFKVSLNTTAKVYRRLDREGALTLVRSSHSIINSRAPRTRLAVRGVVCTPIWLPGFLLFLDWRKWFSQLEEELAHYHFVLEPIFYKFAEERSRAFVDRVLRFNPDYLLWSWPVESSLTTMQSIADMGVPLVIVDNAMQQFPGTVYRTSLERGLRYGLAEWRNAGIKEIVLPLQRKADCHQPLLQPGPLPCRFEMISIEDKSTADLLAYLRRLAPDERTGVVFGDDLLYAHLCSLVPEAMLELIRQRRVMLLRQATIPFRKKMPASLTVDALLFPWQKLARQIARDLGRSGGGSPSEPTTLEAEWCPQIPFARVAQLDFHE